MEHSRNITDLISDRPDNFLDSQAGSTAAIVALSLTALVSIWALSIDLGRAWNLDTELQNAADAAALACATQLDKTAGARARGILAATGGLVQNDQTLADDGLGDAVTFTADDIRFLVDLTTRAEATSDADAHYCEVTTNPRSVSFSFARLVLAQDDVSPQAVAVAENNSAYCGIPPLFFCNPIDPIPFLPDDWAGVGVTLKTSEGSGVAPGNFGLLALPSDAAHILSADEIRDAFGRIRTKQRCLRDWVVTKPGQTTAIATGVNTRFDIYPIGLPTPEGTQMIDNPNYRPALNTVKGLEKTGAQCTLQPGGWRKSAPQYNGPPYSPPPNISVMGYPRDNCAYGGACDVYSGGTALGDGNWDRDAYMLLNHDGASSADLPEPDMTRYEVYQWELATPQLSENLNEEPAPVCNVTNDTYGAPDIDRRVITAAVLDCSELNGTEPAVPEKWVRIFLTEPMGVYDGNNDLYAEIIGEESRGNDNVVRHIVRLVE